ncbi:wee1-like protein kinase 2 [Lampetra planeri]
MSYRARRQILRHIINNSNSSNNNSRINSSSSRSNPSTKSTCNTKGTPSSKVTGKISSSKGSSNITRSDRISKSSSPSSSNITRSDRISKSSSPSSSNITRSDRIGNSSSINNITRCDRISNSSPTTTPRSDRISPTTTSSITRSDRINISSSNIPRSDRINIISSSKMRSGGSSGSSSSNTVVVARRLDWSQDEDSGSSTDDSAFNEDSFCSPPAAIPPPPPPPTPPSSPPSPPPSAAVAAAPRSASRAVVHHPHHQWRAFDPMPAVPSSPEDSLLSGGSPPPFSRGGTDDDDCGGGGGGGTDYGGDDFAAARRLDNCGAGEGGSDDGGGGATSAGTAIDDDDDGGGGTADEDDKENRTPRRPRPRWGFQGVGGSPGEVGRSMRPESPPHKTMHKLRLMDSPHSPKSLRQLARAGAGFRLGAGPTRSTPKAGPRINFNPFTPDSVDVLRSCLHRSRKRESDDDRMERTSQDECPNPPKRMMSMREAEMMSRFSTEFHELGALGHGHFGSVSRCVKRLDGCVYAVKRSRRPVARSADEQSALREVCAHAVLGQHPHVVQYYSAWAEEDHMYIQNEYCSGGSVTDALLRSPGHAFPEWRVRRMLLHVARGLRYIHSLGLVHMDIKPSNIFIAQRTLSSELEEGEPQSDAGSVGESRDVYKIGDLGHVTRVNSRHVEEGDSRFLALEVLQPDYSASPQADVFALALSAVVAAGGGPLPRNDAAWKRIRQGWLPEGAAVASLSLELRTLLTAMVRPTAGERPSTGELCCHPALCGTAVCSVRSLRRALSCERLKNAHLRRELQLLMSKERCPSDRKGVAGRLRRSSSLTP